MKAVVLSIVVSLGIGILLGYVIFGGKTETPMPGPVPVPPKRPAESDSTDAAMDTAAVSPGVTPEAVTTGPRKITKGSSLSAPPKTEGRTAADIAAEKKALSDKLAAKLPQSTDAVKIMAIQEDPAAISKTLEVYAAGDDSKKTTIEITARDNEPLKSKLVPEIEKGYSAEDADIRTASLKSAVRVKAFDDASKARVRPLLKDQDVKVRNEAIAYAGWSQDKQAYIDIVNILKNTEDEKTIVSSLHCLAVIGRGKAEELTPLLIPKLQDKSPRVRQAALSCVFHLREAAQNEEIQSILKKLAETDDYAITVKDQTTYPIREQASEGLKMLTMLSESEG